MLHDSQDTVGRWAKFRTQFLSSPPFTRSSLSSPWLSWPSSSPWSSWPSSSPLPSWWSHAPPPGRRPASSTPASGLRGEVIPSPGKKKSSLLYSFIIIHHQQNKGRILVIYLSHTYFFIWINLFAWFMLNTHNSHRIYYFWQISKSL